jgi:hypothetical protein
MENRQPIQQMLLGKVVIHLQESETPKTTCAGKDVEKKGTLIHCLWECKLVQPLWKKIWRLHIPAV